jgi:phosphomevalonate kinase
MVLSASAPGKVLICGGYLVVESPNVGLSVGVSARFRSTVSSFESTDGGPLIIEVLSPQFNSVFEFTVTSSASDDRVEVEMARGRDSPFLYYGVLTAAAYLRGFGPIGGGSAVITLQADNDFYSQRNYLEQKGEKVTARTLRTVPPFNELVGEVSKTGLGSSAALTTSFVTALCHALARQPAFAARKAEICATEAMHRVAQAAHSVAQGKIGSGFDVHTAVYGTNVYVRFPPSKVDGLMKDKQPRSFTAAQVAACVDPAVEWIPARPLVTHALPRGIQLMLADIHQGGSATPGLVSKIMAWRKGVQGVEGNLWDRLARANESYLLTIQALRDVAAEDPTAYDATVDALRRQPAASWQDDSVAAQVFMRFRDGAATTRRLLREMGEAAGVEIEPPVLTPLLDATLALPGVIAAGCPGAGGYDAIFALVVGGEAEMTAVEAFWETGYAGLHVCPLLVREDSRGGLVVVDDE